MSFSSLLLSLFPPCLPLLSTLLFLPFPETGLRCIPRLVHHSLLECQNHGFIILQPSSFLYQFNSQSPQWLHLSVSFYVLRKGLSTWAKLTLNSQRSTGLWFLRLVLQAYVPMSAVPSVILAPIGQPFCSSGSYMEALSPRPCEPRFFPWTSRSYCFLRVSPLPVEILLFQHLLLNCLMLDLPDFLIHPD